MTAFKIGGKVVPVSKLGQEDLLIYSVCWNRAKENKQPFLYFNGYKDGHVVCSDQKTDEPTGDFFNECDLKPYLTKNKRISNLEKELAHTKEQLETLRGDYLKDIELLQERFQKKIKALEMVLADKSKLRQSDEPIQQDVQRRTVTCGHHVPPYKSPNQLRAELIEEAKEFVKIAGADNIEFAVSEKYRAVTAIWYKGIEVATTTVKCEPDKVFNADIFKAIALGRVQGLDVSEFENAVQPNVAIGQVVTFKGSSTLQVVTRRNPHFTDAWFKDNDAWSYGHELTILDDTNAIYTEEAQ